MPSQSEFTLKLQSTLRHLDLSSRLSLEKDLHNPPQHLLQHLPQLLLVAVALTVMLLPPLLQLLQLPQLSPLSRLPRRPHLKLRKLL